MVSGFVVWLGVFILRGVGHGVTLNPKQFGFGGVGLRV